MQKLSVITPIFNEQDVLPELMERVRRVFNDVAERYGLDCEYLLVNDGSRDRSLEMLRGYASEDERIVVINLSRNFGHQPAIQAGLEQASGDALVVMDGDLQDPPELISQFIESWLLGNHVVIAKRRSRAERGIKGWLFKTFHKWIGRISDLPIETDAGVFGLLDRRVARELIALPERNRFMPGLRSWVGYQHGIVYYEREKRAAGEPKQTFGRLLKYAFDAVFSFSYKPLRAIWTLGFTVSAICILYGIFLIILRVFNIGVVPGFTTPTVAILFLSGIQLISVGVLGEYMGRIYDEVKQRPLFIISEIIRQESAVLTDSESK
jgi:polyisoprenyl-phosphate glycosyltransferase